jgi:hypothetical protein
MQNRIMMVMMLTSMFYVADPRNPFHIRRRPRHDTGKNYKSLRFPDWLSTDADMLTEILVWLSPHMIIIAASSSRFFKDIIISNDFRSRIRRCEVQTRQLLGLFAKTRDNKPERYPFLECCDTSIPLRFRSASFSVWCSWKPYKQWGYVELLDSRDGRLLLLAGENRKQCQFVIVYPQSRYSYDALRAFFSKPVPTQVACSAFKLRCVEL